VHHAEDAEHQKEVACTDWQWHCNPPAKATHSAIMSLACSIAKFAVIRCVHKTAGSRHVKGGNHAVVTDYLHACLAVKQMQLARCVVLANLLDIMKGILQRSADHLHNQHQVGKQTLTAAQDDRACYEPNDGKP